MALPVLGVQTAQLREVVANQELSPEEAQRMIQERERLQEAMTKVTPLAPLSPIACLSYSRLSVSVSPGEQAQRRDEEGAVGGRDGAVAGRREPADRRRHLQLQGRRAPGGPRIPQSVQHLGPSSVLITPNLREEGVGLPLIVLCILWLCLAADPPECPQLERHRV